MGSLPGMRRRPLAKWSHSGTLQFRAIGFRVQGLGFRECIRTILIASHHRLITHTLPQEEQQLRPLFKLWVKGLQVDPKIEYSFQLSVKLPRLGRGGSAFNELYKFNG